MSLTKSKDSLPLTLQDFKKKFVLFASSESSSGFVVVPGVFHLFGLICLVSFNEVKKEGKV